MSEFINQQVIRLIPGHSRNCTYGRTDNDEGDFCTCNLHQRRMELKHILTNYKEIQEKLGVYNQE